MEVTMRPGKKPKKRGCRCTGSGHGSPHYGHGVCYLDGQVREAVRERYAGKRLATEYLRAIDPVDVE